MSEMARVPLLISTSDTGERSGRIPRGRDCRGTFTGLGRELVAAEPKNIN